MRILVRVVATAMIGAATAISMEAAVPASIGRASMPSTVAQYLGYGYGVGRHAPIVRTPGMHPERVPRNVRVPRYAGPLYPAPYEPLRCYGEACYGSAARVPAYSPASPAVEPARSGGLVPTPADASAPAVFPEADRQVWRRPF